MYASGNPKTKKQLKEWIQSGREVEVFQPGLGEVPRDGRITLEGPHYPEPHRWYATGVMKDGKLVKVS